MITAGAAASPHAGSPIAKRCGADRVATNLDNYDGVRAPEPNTRRWPAVASRN